MKTPRKNGASPFEALLDVPRSKKPRSSGLTVMMDRGYGTRMLEDLLDVAAPWIDYVKLGWGTGAVTDNLDKKIAILRSSGVGFLFGGTLLEAFLLRDGMVSFHAMLRKFKPDLVEISDGVVNMRPGQKQKLIKDLATDFRVISEVGRKDPSRRMSSKVWAKTAEQDLDAGAWKVVCEARENGRAGIFTVAGDLRQKLVEDIARHVPSDRLLFEAPTTPAQAWLIRRFGPDVNLANIGPFDVIPLETLRRGLRADTLTTWAKKPRVRRSPRS